MGEGNGEGEIDIQNLKIQTPMYNINEQHGYFVQHMEIQSLFCNNFKQYKSIKILNHHAVHLKLIYTIFQ